MAAKQSVRTTTRTSTTRTRVRSNGSSNGNGYKQCNICHGTGVVRKKS